MKKRPWIFSAITSLLLAFFVLSSQTFFGLVLLIFWFIRMRLLKDKNIFWQTMLVSSFFVTLVCFHKQENKSVLTGEETKFMLSPDLSSIKIDGDKLSFNGTLQNDDKKEKIVVGYYFQTDHEKKEWLRSKIPSHLLVTGEIIEPASNSNFYQFNYRAYLKRNKIHWLLNATEVRFLDNPSLKPSIGYKINQVRYRIIQYIDRIFDGKVSSYLKILFLADRTAITERTKESYRALGLIHLFSISGFHISYLTELIKKLFLRIGITHERTNIFLVLFLPLYGLVAGLSVSVFRAVFQRTLLLWGAIVEREINSLDAWSLAMIASLMINPYNLFELSFQLSYSLSGLFILMGKQEWIRDLDSLKQALLFSTLSFFVSLPLLSYHFYEISWITILANMIFTPFFIFILFPSLVVLFILSFPFSTTTLFHLLNKMIGFLLNKMEVILFYLTKKYDFSFVIGRLPQITLALLVLCVLHLVKKMEQKKRPNYIIFICLFLFLNWNQISPVGYVLMLDVGQGDSILIKEPGSRKTTLIDTGGEIQWQKKEKWQEREETFTIGKDIVVPSLKSHGISSIDRLYITHAHHDHMGETRNIHDELKIEEIATTYSTFQDEEFIKQLVSLKDVSLVPVEPAMELNYPTLQTLALHPIQDYQNKNDQSLVLYVKMGEDSWLFTGDMEADAEKDMIQNYPKLKVDYLKAGHHGSKTSSREEFIDHIEPKFALISVGQKNSYGHPDSEVLDLFAQKKIHTYSTAEDGAIKVSYIKIPFLNKWITKIQTVK